MGAVMYAGPQLAASPYAHLLEPAHWSDVQDMFMRDACALMGLSIESPLGGSTVFCIFLAVIRSKLVLRIRIMGLSIESPLGRLTVFCIFSCHTEINQCCGSGIRCLF
jgi:hypothetical protein